MKTENGYTFESQEYVQFYLDNLNPLQKFKVIFMKVDGTQRELTGNLDPNGKTRLDNIPVQTADGWKSFNRNRVLWIGEPVEPEYDPNSLWYDTSAELEGI